MQNVIKEGEDKGLKVGREAESQETDEKKTARKTDSTHHISFSVCCAALYVRGAGRENAEEFFCVCGVRWYRGAAAEDDRLAAGCQSRGNPMHIWQGLSVYVWDVRAEEVGSWQQRGGRVYSFSMQDTRTWKCIAQRPLSLYVEIILNEWRSDVQTNTPHTQEGILR